MNDLTTLSIAEAAPLIASRHIAPTELTEAYLSRIDAYEERLNCFITVMAEQAEAAAAQATREIAGGEYRGPLHGIPIGLKDLFDTAGTRTTAGSRFFTDRVPQTDARVTARLAEAGAIVLGKLSMHEWALGVTGVNPHYGTCRNPWEVARITGGSSSGSAAALAARLCAGALGSDTGGSIRIPAALCGVVGLKPTVGRVSLAGTVPLSWNLDHAGPMARSAADVALLYNAIAGYDADDAASVDAPLAPIAGLDEPIAGMRIAVASGPYCEEIDGEIASAIAAAAATFAALGTTISPVDMEAMREAAQMNALMTQSDAAAFHRERLVERPDDFGEDVRERLRRGASYTSTEYILARRHQALWKRQLDGLFASYDLLLTPATALIAPFADGQDAIEAARQLTRFTAPFNLAGVPAVVLPCGFTAGGLPIGVQLVARPWAEQTALHAAHAFERATAWHRRRPPL